MGQNFSGDLYLPEQRLPGLGIEKLHLLLVKTQPYQLVNCQSLLRIDQEMDALAPDPRIRQIIINHLIRGASHESGEQVTVTGQHVAPKPLNAHRPATVTWVAKIWDASLY